jgi:hypothetical protein
LTRCRLQTTVARQREIGRFWAVVGRLRPHQCIEITSLSPVIRLHQRLALHFWLVAAANLEEILGMEPTREISHPMQRQPADNRHHRRNGEPRTVSAVIPRPGRKARTTLARRRRLNALVRELALDLGFQLNAVTLAERGVLHQCATLMLQVELAQDTLVRGDGIIDPDVCIRLSSEARRLLAGLRKRAGKQEAPPPLPWSPLRSRITAPAAKPEVVK